MLQRGIRPFGTFVIPQLEGICNLEMHLKSGSAHALVLCIPALLVEMNTASSDWKRFIPMSDALSSVYEALDLSASKRDDEGRDEVAPVMEGCVYNVFDSLPADDSLMDTEIELKY